MVCRPHASPVPSSPPRHPAYPIPTCARVSPRVLLPTPPVHRPRRELLGESGQIHWSSRLASVTRIAPHIASGYPPPDGERQGVRSTDRARPLPDRTPSRSRERASELDPTAGAPRPPDRGWDPGQGRRSVVIARIPFLLPARVWIPDGIAAGRIGEGQ
ncbi:hypothetical protein ZWY2020_025758 [Hordeum vulgare]|nr:hypothetical protein ZWY2020_025758 [Hordeum vulgare]